MNEVVKMKLSDTLIDKDTGLNEREQNFLDILFDEADGDIELAMELAGYPKSFSVSSVRRKLSKEIKQYTKDYLVSQTPKAARELVKVFRDPNAMGTKNILTAAKEILDRGDVNKEETKYEIPENFIVLLPPKRGDLVVDLRKEDWETRSAKTED